MTSWGNQCTYSLVLFPFSLPDAADCPLKHPLNGKPQKGQSVTEGSDARGGINRWGWVDDSRDSKHNEQIKRLCRLKCHSSSQRRQAEVSGNSCFCCDSQQPLLSAGAAVTSAACRVCRCTLSSFRCSSSSSPAQLDHDCYRVFLSFFAWRPCLFSPCFVRPKLQVPYKQGV